MPHSGPEDEPRIDLDEMRKKSAAIATLCAWINNRLDIA